MFSSSRPSLSPAKRRKWLKTLPLPQSGRQVTPIIEQWPPRPGAGIGSGGDVATGLEVQAISSKIGTERAKSVAALTTTMAGSLDVVGAGGSMAVGAARQLRR